VRRYPREITRLVLGEIVAAGVEHDGERSTLEEAGFKYSG